MLYRALRYMIRGKMMSDLMVCNRLAPQHHVDCTFIILYTKSVVKRFYAIFKKFFKKFSGRLTRTLLYMHALDE